MYVYTSEAAQEIASAAVIDGIVADIDNGNALLGLFPPLVNHSFLFTMYNNINTGNWINENRNNFLELPLSDFW